MIARAVSLCKWSFPATLFSLSSRFSEGKSESTACFCSGGLAGEIWGGELAIRFCPEYVWGSGSVGVAWGGNVWVTSSAEGGLYFIPSFLLIFLLELAMLILLWWRIESSVLAWGFVVRRCCSHCEKFISVKYSLVIASFNCSLRYVGS